MRIIWRMSRAWMLCGVLTAIVALTGPTAAQQSGLALARLTVPDATLPEDCRLLPYVPPTTQTAKLGTTTVIRPQAGNSGPFPANPWSGTDPKLVSTVRGSINGVGRSRPLPDVPLPGSGQPAVPSSERTDDVLEAYRAAYQFTDGFGVQVFAVTFKDAKLAAAPDSLSAMLNPPIASGHRLVRGATAIRVSASSENACYKAVVGYIESLK
jgi:hypothetical protein